MESGLDVPTTSSTLTPGEGTAEMTATAEDTIGVARSSSELRLADRCQQLTAMNDAEKVNNTGSLQGATVTNALNANELEKCACTVDILESSSTVIIDSDANGNHNSNEVRASANTNVDGEMMIDQNANGQTITEEVSTLAAENSSTVFVAASSPKNVSIKEFVTSSSHTIDAGAANLPQHTTLDAINANSGIIRVDMSKIIDQTGLPTYEAAAKLESSGYV